MDGDVCMLLQTHVANLTIILGENGSWYCLKMPPIIYVNTKCWWCHLTHHLSDWCLLVKCMHIEKQSKEIIILLRRCVKSFFFPPLPVKCMHIEKQSKEIIILLRRCVKSFFFPPLPGPQACMEGGQGVCWIYVNGMCI